MSWDGDYGWDDNDFLSKPMKNKKFGGNNNKFSSMPKTKPVQPQQQQQQQQQQQLPLSNHYQRDQRDLSPLLEKKMLYEGKASSLQRSRAQSRKSKLFNNQLDGHDSSDDDGDDDDDSAMFSPQKYPLSTAATPHKGAASATSALFTPQKSYSESLATPKSTSQKMKRGGVGAVETVKSKALAALSSSSNIRATQPSPSKVMGGNQQYGSYPETHTKLMQSPYYRALFAASSDVNAAMKPSSVPSSSSGNNSCGIPLSPDPSLKRLSIETNFVGTPSKVDPSEETKLDKLHISVPPDDSSSAPPSIYWPPLSSSAHLFKDDGVHTPSQRGRSSSMLRTPLRTPVMSRNVSYNSTSGVMESANGASLGSNSPFRQELSSSIFISSAAVLEKEVPKPALPSLPSNKNFMADFPKVDQLPKVEAMRLARSLFDRLIGDKQSKTLQAKKTKRWDDPDSEDEDLNNKDGEDSEEDDDKYIFEDFQTVLEDFHLPSPLPEVYDESVKITQQEQRGEASAQEAQTIRTPQPSKCFLFAASSSSLMTDSSKSNGNGKIIPPKKKKLNYDLIDFVWFHQLLLSSTYINQEYFSLPEEERNQHLQYSELLLHHLIKKGFYFDLTNALTVEDDRFDSTRLELLKIIYESSPHLLYLDPEDEEEDKEDSAQQEKRSISSSGSNDEDDKSNSDTDDEDEDKSHKVIRSPSTSSSVSSHDNDDKGVTSSSEVKSISSSEIEIPVRQIIANAVEHACSDRWQRCWNSTYFATCSELDSNFLAKRGFTQQVVDQSKALAAAELDYSLHAIVKSSDERPPYKVWDHDRNVIELMKHMIKREVKSCLNRLVNQEEDRRIWLRSTACLRSLCHSHQYMLRCYGHRLGQTSELVENQRLLTLLLDVLEGLLIWDFTLKVEYLALSSKDEDHLEDLSFDAIRSFFVFIQRRWRLSCEMNTTYTTYGGNGENDNKRSSNRLDSADDEDVTSPLNYAQEIAMAKSLEVILIFARVINAWNEDEDVDDSAEQIENGLKHCSTHGLSKDRECFLKSFNQLRQNSTKKKLTEVLMHRCIHKFITILSKSDHVKLIQNVLAIIQNASLLDNFFFGNVFDRNESRLCELVETLRTLRCRHWNPAIQNNSSICLDLIIERMNREEENDEYD